MSSSAPRPSADRHRAGQASALHEGGAIVRLEPRNDDEPEQRPLDLAVLTRLYGYTMPYARKRNVLFVLVLLRAVQVPAIGWIVASVISGPIAGHDPTRTLMGVGVLLLAVLSTNVVFHFRMRLALELGESVVRDLRNAVHGHLLRMPMSFFARAKVGRLIGRVTSDVDVVRIGVQDATFVSIVQAGIMVVAAALMVHYDWQLFLVVLAMVPVLFAVVRHFREKLTEAYRSAQESFSRVTATLAESVTGIRVTQGFARQDLNGGLFRTLIYDHSQYNMGAAKHSAIFLPMLEFNGQLFLAILLVVGGQKALRHDISMETLVQFFFLANLFFNPIPVLGNQYNQALTAMAGAERIFRLLDTTPEWTDQAGAKPLPRVAGQVEFRRVSLAYEPGKPVLRDVSFTALPGQTVALAGHTGSGKTSIINLLAKLYLPSSGQILIDGHDVAEVSSGSLHEQMGSVLQSNFLFSGTVLDNVRVGRPSATEAQVIEAARALGVADLIEALPRGLATEVGERGAALSLGQRQVICFVRAVLVDPRIIVLDEATSSMDTITESRLQEALARLLAGRTSFVIAHRLSTIRHADLVLVLDGGRIVERGTHEELVALGGVYAEMYRLFVAT